MASAAKSTKIKNAMKFQQFLLLIFLFQAACAPAAPVMKDDQPPPLTIGVDTTFLEGRPIEDLRFAAVYITRNSEIRRFDDIGRMAIYLSQQSNEPSVSGWVFDYETAEPIRTESAFFVASTSLVTPRGSGIIAVADSERADLLARQNGGRVMSWDETTNYLTSAPDFPLMPSTSGGGLGGLLEADR